VITRSNVGKELSDVASCDHIDLAACWSCGTVSSANLETINSKSTCVMDIRVRRLLLAAAESHATVESGHVFPLRRRRPTPLSLVRMTSWPPTLPCVRWPPLRRRFCTTAQIRGFLSTPAARYERTLPVSWWAKAAPPNGVLPRLCTACCMDHPGRLSWFGERGAKGSISGCLARQRGAGNEGRATKASPSWHMLNRGVSHHWCAPVLSPATERSKSAL